jgi:SAM-dependent methyltransferase
MDPRRFDEHYQLQAQWLEPSRRYLFRKSGLARRRRILDLGCGSGVIADQMRRLAGRPVTAVDRDPAMVEFAGGAYPGNDYLAGDERVLARRGLRFDLVVISFVLLWQPRPLPFLKRLRKLLDAGGALLVLAEPDYGGRIDFPADLDFLKDIFAGHIAGNGGDPFIGRRLAALLAAAGFHADVELASALTFPSGFVDAALAKGGCWEREWRFWQELAGFPDALLAKIMRLERRAAARCERLVLFPVFCALATPR